MDFRTEVEERLQGLSREQVCRFAWLCGVRALPFLSAKREFACWTKGDRQRHLYSIFNALDTCAGNGWGVAAADDAAARAAARAAAYAVAYAAARAAAAAGRAAYDAYIAAVAAYAAYDAAYDDDAAAAAADAAVDAAYAAYDDDAADAAARAADAAARATAYAVARTVARTAARTTFEEILLEDIEAIKNNNLADLNNDTNIYGKTIWQDFLEDLNAVGCGYWAQLYENLFNKRFDIDVEELKRRLSVPDKIKYKGAATVEWYLRTGGPIDKTTTGIIDNNSHSMKPFLNIDKISNGLADILNNTEHSVCFGILGVWGRGKTHLSEQVSTKLEKQNYRIIKFSAWKYRSTPELWAHLYESFSNQLRSESWFAVIRSGIYRHGLWSVIVALFLISMPLFISLFLHGKNFTAVDGQRDLDLFVSIIGYLGYGGGAATLVLTTFFNNVNYRNFFAHCKNIFFLPVHRDKMGLQATIGDDLVAIVRAWIPKTKKKNEDKGDKKDKENEKSKVNKVKNITPFLEILLYVVLWTTASISLSQYLQNASSGNTIGFDIDTVAASVILTLAILPVVVFWREIIDAISTFINKCVNTKHINVFANKPKRILLIVDDLDRCVHDQLEIIESIMLLCKDERIPERLHVCLLVEYEILKEKILDKYKQLKSSYSNERLVRENIEKLFDAYLRLGSIKNLQKLFDGIIQAKKPDSPEPPPDTTTKDDNHTFTDEQSSGESTEREKQKKKTPAKPIPGSPPEDGKPEQSPPKPEKNETQITQDEKDAILKAALKLYSPPTEYDDDYWTPRAVRHLEMKYRLAHTIIKHVDENLIDETITYKNNYIINAILEKSGFTRKDGKEVSETTLNNTTFQEIIDMVTCPCAFVDPQKDKPQ